MAFHNGGRTCGLAETASRCDTCNEISVTVQYREDGGQTTCATCYADALAFGHLHGLHQDEDGEALIVEGCPSCAGFTPACYR